ncbi:MAG TPA: DUF998 domain-containing protein [Blastococcus sp.]|jgi:hypothetical membrane protein|nr:DUF998 domain-containing protein [Blastococcus sp.]
MRFWGLATLGVASALTLDLVILGSIALSPWFSIYNNELSDLGNTDSNGSVGFGFDAGLGLAGILMFAFAALMSYKTRDRKVLLWTTPLAATAVALAMVGAFPENSPGSVHRVVSGVLFLMIAITLLSYGSLSRWLGSRRARSMALVFGLLTAYVWVTTWPWSGVVNQWSVWPWGGVAIQESLTAAMLTTWLVIVAMKTKGLRAK